MMWILAAILFFIFESIAAAGKGDRSGLDIIGKVLMATGTFFFIGWIITGFSTDGSGMIFLFSIIIAIVGGVLSAFSEQ